MLKHTFQDLIDTANLYSKQVINKISKINENVDRKITYSVVAILLGGVVVILFIKKKSKSTKKPDFLMKGIISTGYDGIASLKITKNLVKPRKIASNELVIRVKAVSIDPADIRILQGYGRNITSRIAKKQKCLDEDLKAVLGRDCAGIVEEVGEEVREFKIGDEVWGYSPPWKKGLMTEFVVIPEDFIARKPKNINFEDASSVPYAALVTWDALVNQAGLNPESAKDKRVLIHLGSYAIGALAIQLVKLWGGHVTTTVPTMGLPLVRYLGADDVIVYSVSNFQEELLDRKKFDIVFNTAGSILHELSVSICSSDGYVVSAVAPFPSNLENQGLFYKLISNLWMRTKTELFEIFENGMPLQRWEAFSFDKFILSQIKDLIETGKVIPIVEDVFRFDDALKAFERVASGDTVGRTVIKME